MGKFLKQYRYGIITTVVILVILTAAFFSGGEIPSKQDETEPSAETVCLAQEETESGIAEEATVEADTTMQDTEKDAATEQTKKALESTKETKQEAATEGETDSQREEATTDDTVNGTQSATQEAAITKQETDTTKQQATTKQEQATGKKKTTTGKTEGATTKKETTTTKKETATTKKEAATTKKETATTKKGTTTDGSKIKVTLSISCKTVLSNMDQLTAAKKSIIPSDGWILKAVTVEVQEGKTVFDVLQQVCKDKKIPMEFTKATIYDTAYIEGINNLYEFDCGECSGWMYTVNGIFPNYGCSDYTLEDGDVIAFLYTCEYGLDLQ